MNKERIISMMAHPTLMPDTEIAILQEMVDKYPFSATLRLLLVQSLNFREDIRTKNELKKAAIHAPTRKQLHGLLNTDLPEPTEVDTASNDTSIPSESQAKDDIILEKQYYTRAVESTIKLEVGKGHSLPSRDDLAALKKKKKTSKPPKETVPDSFYDFLSSSVKIGNSNDGVTTKNDGTKSFFDPELMAKNSLIDRNDFVTETLADIYLRQGYYDKAMQAFEQLSLKNPEKSSYFADRIEKIKKSMA